MLTPGGHFDEEIVEVPISAIEHYSYCPRQCALIHVEQTFEENQFTIRGRIAHERVDQAGERSVRGDRVIRGMPLWSDRLRLRGRADAVEMRVGGPYPVEYKVGIRRGAHADLQLCAQALCLEEMLGVKVPEGAVYYRQARHRQVVRFDEALRGQTVAIIEEVRRQIETGQVPDAPDDARCRRCSLLNACLPGVVSQRRRIRLEATSLLRPLSLDDTTGDAGRGGSEAHAGRSASGAGDA